MQDNALIHPTAEAEYEYVGFWLRTWAAVIDSVITIAAMAPVLVLVGFLTGINAKEGPVGFFFSWIAPALGVLAFWIAKKATPGKMLIGAEIRDANTGGAASKKQLIGRYAGYYVSMLSFFIGILWVGFDPRKQGWHDKLAGTVVVRRKTARAVA